MTISRGQLVEVEFNLPQGNMKHPAIVLSTSEINDLEQAFVCVMCTSVAHDDELSFVLTNEMLNKSAIEKHSEVRIHLIGFFHYKDIIPNKYGLTMLKERYLKQLICEINENVFGFEIQL